MVYKLNLTVRSNGITKIIEIDANVNLLSVLQNNGYRIPASCGGNGKCRKCKVKVISGITADDGFCLACKTILNGNAEIEVFESDGTGLTEGVETKYSITSQSGYGIAFDIGTTTLAFMLVNLADGNAIETVSALNPQSSFGADVISRIKSASEGKKENLHKAIVDKTKEIITEILSRQKISRIEKMFVSGNTTMINLFLNEDVSEMGVAPYRAKVLDSVTVEGKEIGFPDIKSVTTLPSICAFVGSDITAGALSSNVSDGNNMLIDIGTNGEMILSANGKIICGSTAAGPCFEGAKIECGMGGIDGAISKIQLVNGKIRFNTIGGGKPIGICGSGLIDAVAAMLDLGVIDKTGAFASDESKFYVSDEVYISSKDIREFQLAKSAICSGLKVLISKSGLNTDDIDNYYIAGGLGFYLDSGNAIKTGLIPKFCRGKIKVVGNTSLIGAKTCMMNVEYLEKTKFIAKTAINFDFSNDAMFFDEYINNMMF